MIIKSVPVNAFIEYLYCDCGEEMERDNVVLTSNPPKYKYVCPKCGKIEYVTEHYPKTVYKEKELITCT
jgi:hypothetical protein